MPTPFYHLSLAEEIVAHPDLPDEIRAILTEHRCAFFLGKTAPDVQSLTGHSRRDTHFFAVPPDGTVSPEEHVLLEHPELSDSSQLPPAHAAFLAGYLCHLQADIAWIDQIYLPNFSDEIWPNKRHRYYIHNALRAYLDEIILAEMPDGVGACVGKAQPDKWLPFVEDDDLIEWRDLIAEQLAPGAKIHTAEIFAIRMDVDIEQFTDLIASKERIESEVLIHVHAQELVKYRRFVIKENLELLSNYLSIDKKQSI